MRVNAGVQLARDLPFRKLCRLGSDQGVPDPTTIGRFRAQLGARLDLILSDVDVVAQLEDARVVLAESRVPIVYATVDEAAQSRISIADPREGNTLKTKARGKPAGLEDMRDLGVGKPL